MSARTTCGHELRGHCCSHCLRQLGFASADTANGRANASLLLRALKPHQLNPNEGDYICASRRRSVSGAPLTIFGVANFGRPQLQYNTFDLAKLPSGSGIESAYPPPHGAAKRLATPQIKDSQSLSVNSESKTRSTDNSAEREPHGSEFFTSKPGSQPKVRSGPEDGCVAQ